VALIGALLVAGTGIVLLVVIMGGLSFAQLFFSDRLALAAMGAKEVSPQQAPGLHAMIERLCIQADLPKPRIAVADTHVPTPSPAGALRRARPSAPPRDHVGAVRPASSKAFMAHELTHVKNRDVLIMTIASFFASIAAIILQFGFFFGGGSDDDNPSFAIVLVVLVRRLHRVLSSDARAVALPRVRGRPRRGDHHRTPERAVLALVKISDAMQKVPTRTCARRAHERLLHRADEREGAVQTLFATHRRWRSGSRGCSSSRRSCRPPPKWLPRRSAGRPGQARQGRGSRRLFAMTTAQVTLDTGLGLQHKGATGIVFQPLETADFDGILRRPRSCCAPRARTPERRWRPQRTSTAIAG